MHEFLVVQGHFSWPDSANHISTFLIKYQLPLLLRPPSKNIRTLVHVVLVQIIIRVFIVIVIIIWNFSVLVFSIFIIFNFSVAPIVLIVFSNAVPLAVLPLQTSQSDSHIHAKGGLENGTNYSHSSPPAVCLDALTTDAAFPELAPHRCKLLTKIVSIVLPPSMRIVLV
jgi:hypothetical protein